jgi:hypothetical protein
MFNRHTTIILGLLVRKQGHIKNVAWFNGWLYPQSQDTDSADTTSFHLYQATLSDTDSGNVWLDGQKVMTDGSGANDGTNRKPGQISFGGDNRGNHTRSKCRIAEFIVLNRVVPEAERLKIEGYLTRKWGMMNTMFSAAHPYFASDPYEPTVTQGGEDASLTFYWGDDVKQGTTTLNFATGQSNNADLSSTFGNSLSTSTTGATVTDGGTPNISVAWTAAANVLEVHGSTGLYWDHIDPSSSGVDVLQLDLDGGEADPYVTFTVGSGKVLHLDSVIVGHSTAQTVAAHAWTLTISKVGGSQVASYTTTEMDAGDQELVRLDFTGEVGSSYILKFGDNGNNGNHGAIDNLIFGQIDTAGWDSNYAVSGTHGIGVVSHPLTGLTAGTTYYYTAKATNSAGTNWGPVQSFVPANTALNKYSIPDLALWIDASDLDGDGTTDSVTNGASISTWTDKSLTGAIVNQANSDNQPTRQTNSFGTKPGVRFDGTNDFLNISSLRSDNGAYSAYAVVRRADQSGDNSGYLIGAADWNLMPSSSNAPFPAIVSQKTGTSGTLTNLKIGKSTSTTTNDFGGDLSEMLIFTRELSSTDEQKVQGYLAHKWGATAGPGCQPSPTRMWLLSLIISR